MQLYEQLEANLAEWIGTTRERVVSCASGTAALHLALEALQLPQGSSVIVPDYTMIACARAVVMAGLNPIFVGCKDDLLIDTDEVARLCDSSQKDDIFAIMPVHIYGRRCNMNAIHSIALLYDLAVIEDMAEIHGIAPHPYTDAACWSFYANKIVHGEEGGAVAFNGEIDAKRARSLRCLGFTEEHDFMHTPRGHNYRMSNAHARLIVQSLHRVEGEMEERRRLEGIYEEECPQGWRMPTRNAPWVYDLRIPNIDSKIQTGLVKTLRMNGIEARHGFKPMSWQEEFKGCKRVGDDTKMRRIAREVIYLPIQPGVTIQESIELSFQVIRTYLRGVNHSKDLPLIPIS